MRFADDLRRFTLKVEARRHAAFVMIATETLRSIQEGSVLTGAPGQPVYTGTLKASWHLEFDGPDHATISTNVAYARAIEDLVGPHGTITIRSEVGGGHSVKLTRAGFHRIVASVAARVGGGSV